MIDSLARQVVERERKVVERERRVEIKSKDSQGTNGLDLAGL